MCSGLLFKLCLQFVAVEKTFAINGQLVPFVPTLVQNMLFQTHIPGNNKNCSTTPKTPRQQHKTQPKQYHTPHQHLETLIRHKNVCFHPFDSEEDRS